jgi:hypothetical protein
MRETIEAYLARGGVITVCPTMPARGLMEIERLTGVTVSYQPAPPDCTVGKADDARAKSRLSGNAANRAKGDANYAAIKACRGAGMNTTQICAHLGLTKRTVNRHSQIMREEAIK